MTKRQEKNPLQPALFPVAPPPVEHTATTPPSTVFSNETIEFLKKVPIARRDTRSYSSVISPIDITEELHPTVRGQEP